MQTKYNYFTLSNQKNKITDISEVKDGYFDLISTIYKAKRMRVYEDKPYFVEFISDSEFFITKEDKNIINCKFVFVEEFEHNAICMAFSLNNSYPVLLVDTLTSICEEINYRELIENLKISVGHFLVSKKADKNQI